MWSLEEERTETKMQMPTRAQARHHVAEHTKSQVWGCNPPQPAQNCTHIRHNLASCRCKQGEPGSEDGWHGSPGRGPALGTSREPSEAPGHSQVSPWQPPRGPVPPARLYAKQGGESGWVKMLWLFQKQVLSPKKAQ